MYEAHEFELVALSVGITFGTGTSPDELLAQADRALYEVKRSGGGHFRVAEGGP